MDIFGGRLGFVLASSWHHADPSGLHLASSWFFLVSSWLLFGDTSLFFGVLMDIWNPETVYLFFLCHLAVICAFSWLSFGSIWSFQHDVVVSFQSFCDTSVTSCAMSQAWNINPPPSAVFQLPSGWHDPRAVFLRTHPIQNTA